MNNFTIREGSIEGLKIIEGKKHMDARGYFTEIYRKDSFAELGFCADLCQSNLSFSEKGVVRGMHYQKKHAQGKLVRVLQGAIYDVAVDLRKESESFGSWEGILLTEDNSYQFYVPEGFAHGFLSLSDETMVLYHCTDVYCPGEESGIHWQDPGLAIDWPLAGIDRVLLSDKDAKLPSLASMLETEGF
ncbi:dTDP-4-dehydrorhamnose 3,5-epimerase [Clostridia bacterium]|nr:dTDP-4-dehydrorhamnose 3,5-epimerase [Clostridia bacterium]